MYKVHKTEGCIYFVLQREDYGLVDIEFDCDFRFASTDVAVGAGWVEYTRHQQLLSQIRKLI